MRSTRSGFTISTERSDRSARHTNNLLSDWRDVLPTQSVCLQVPIVMPEEYDECWAEKLRSEAARKARGTDDFARKGRDRRRQ